MLEAVHLLLAFDLFVVVVGVDVRWLKGSLGRYYKSQLAEDDGDKSDGQASVDEYSARSSRSRFGYGHSPSAPTAPRAATRGCWRTCGEPART